MKLFGNYKFWILLIFAISFYIILTLELNYFPRFPSFIPINSENFNNFFLAIGYSLFTAVVFYYFSVVLPRNIQIKRNKQIVGKQVHSLLYELFVLLNQILYVYDIKKDLTDLEEKDLLSINGNTTKSFSGYYRTSLISNSYPKKGKKITGFGDVPFNFPESIKNGLSKIPEKIEQIRKSNPNFYIDENFSEIISSIETNKIIKWHGTGDTKLFLYGNSSKFLFSLIQDYKRLNKLKYQETYLNSYSEIYFYNEEEVKNTRNKTGLSDFIDRQDFYHSKIIILNPLIILNPENQNLNIFLNSGTTANFPRVDYKEMNDKNPQNKCIIIFSEEIPRSIVNGFIKKFGKDKLLIVISPSLYFTSKNIPFIKQKISYGTYKLMYRSKFIFLNKNYPKVEFSTYINNIIYYLIYHFDDSR